MEFIWGFPLLHTTGYGGDDLNAMNVVVSGAFCIIVVLVGIYRFYVAVKKHKNKQKIKSIFITLGLIGIAWLLGVISFPLVILIWVLANPKPSRSS